MTPNWYVGSGIANYVPAKINMFIDFICTQLEFNYSDWLLLTFLTAREHG